MIPRIASGELLALSKPFKAIAVIGPGQSGKTTLTQYAFPEKPYIILENASGLYPVEIKSGKTVTAEYFRNLNYWLKLSGQSNGTVIYSGTETQHRSSGIEVLPWQQLEDFLPYGI